MLLASSSTRPAAVTKMQRVSANLRLAYSEKSTVALSLKSSLFRLLWYDAGMYKSRNVKMLQHCIGPKIYITWQPSRTVDVKGLPARRTHLHSCRLGTPATCDLVGLRSISSPTTVLVDIIALSLLHLSCHRAAFTSQIRELTSTAKRPIRTANSGHAKITNYSCNGKDQDLAQACKPRPSLATPTPSIYTQVLPAVTGPWRLLLLTGFLLGLCRGSSPSGVG